MPMWLCRLAPDESGQDLVEYTLLLAFVVIVSAALLSHGQESITAIWCKTDNSLQKASTTAGL